MELVQAETCADGLKEITHNRVWKLSIHGVSPKNSPAQDLRWRRDRLPLSMGEESAVQLDAMIGTVSVEKILASARESRGANERMPVAELTGEERRISAIAFG